MSKILILEIDELFRQYLAALLSRERYAVHAPAHRADMESALLAGRFDAVVTELYMPDLDGIEVVRVLKHNFPSIPVIGLTGSSLGPLDPCGKAMLAFGAEAVLTKPIEAEPFLAILRGALEGRESAEQCRDCTCN